MRAARPLCSVLLGLLGGLAATAVCGATVGCGRASDPPAPFAAASAPPSVASVASAGAAPSTSVSASASVVASASVAPSVVVPTGPFVTTTRYQSWIFEKPKADAPHVGWLHAGTRARRSAEPVAGTGCTGKWWALDAGGFVCEGKEGVTTDLDDPTVKAVTSVQPNLEAPLPFGYATSLGAPLYAKVPDAATQKQLEGDVAAHLAQVEAQRKKTDPSKLPPVTAVPLLPMPSFLEGGAQPPNVVGWNLPKSAVTNGYAWTNLRVAIEAAFESGGRTFYLTTEHLIVPADKMRAARLADFQGVELAAADAPGPHLPMMWVRWKPAKVFDVDATNAAGVKETAETLQFQAHSSIAPKERVLGGVRYFELLDEPRKGKLVRAADVTRVDAATDLPYMVGPDDAWIEVSILRQSLVLYRGKTPVFATLVSTGADGVGDVETTRSTPRGHFRLQSKHATWRMAGDEHPPWKEGDKPDPRYRIDDVPWVQYFHGGYALHAAFWHDSFGMPKSHGCINLSPRDALWLFGKTEPKLPAGWHGVYGGRAGTALGTTLIVKAY